MNGANDRSLQERVDRLETTVAEMHNVLGQLRGSGIRPNPSARRAAGKPISPPTPSQNVIPQRPSSTVVGNSESWLKIVGIGLLLFGVGFLFKFSVEQGWLTERVRIGFGLALGTGLLVTGIRLQADRRPFSQVLLGGGVATYYITGFAAYQLYALLAHPVAFAFMGAVTLFAFFLALRQQAAILSVVGAVGGLGTPFLLYTDAGTVPGLVGYTCLVLGGATAIYLYRGWRSLLWTSFVGGWAVFLVGIHEGDLSDPDRGALQAGLLFAWMVFWAVPVIRGVLTGRNPARWAVPALGVGPVAIRKLAIGHTHLLSAPGPLLALGSTGLVWSLSAEQTGWLAAGGALAYATAAEALRLTRGGGHLAGIQALVGLLLLTISLCLLLHGDTLFFALAAEATVLHLISRRTNGGSAAASAHLLFVIAGVWLATRLVLLPVAGAVIFNAAALTNLAVIAATAGISVMLRSSQSRVLYRLAAHVAILGWLLKELYTLDGGQGYLTVTWGIYGVTLLIVGLRLNLQRLVVVAMGTLLLVVGKLFLVDLATVETIWRILLFLGFGGLFLVLSFYFQVIWRRPPEAV